MIALELNGTHVGRKARFRWKLDRRNAKQHDVVGTIQQITHTPEYTNVHLLNNYYDYVPFSAEVEFLDDPA